MTTVKVDLRGQTSEVVEAYRLDRYDNFERLLALDSLESVVEAYRLDRYDNLFVNPFTRVDNRCRSLSFG